MPQGKGRFPFDKMFKKYSSSVTLKTKILRKNLLYEAATWSVISYTFTSVLCTAFWAVTFISY